MKRQAELKRYNAVKIIGTFVIATILVGGIWGIKANAAQRADNDKAEYQIQEICLKNEIRSCLEEMGYYNSGITMTKVMEADGSREYSVLLHHSDLDTKDEVLVNDVYVALSYIQPKGDNMTVNYTIF